MESPNKPDIVKIHRILIVLIFTNFYAGMILGIIGVYIPGIRYLIQLDILEGSVFQIFLDVSSSFLEWGQASSSIVLGVWTIITIRSTQFHPGIRHSKRRKRRISPDKLFYSTSKPQNGTIELTLISIIFLVNFVNTPGIRSLIIKTLTQSGKDLLLMLLSGFDLIGVICYFFFWNYLGKIYASYSIMKKATTWIRVGNIHSLFLAFTLFMLNLNNLASIHSDSFLPMFILDMHFIYLFSLVCSLGILVFKSIGNELLTEQRNVQYQD